MTVEQLPPELLRSTPRPVRLTALGRGMVALAVSLVAAAIGVSVWVSIASESGSQRREQIISTGVTVRAQIILLTRAGEDKRERVARYRYSAGGSTYEGSKRFPKRYGSRLSEGGELAVRYLPSEPGRSWVVGFEPKGGPPFWVAPLAFFGIGGCGVPIIYRLRRDRHLLSRGRPALARVTHSKKFDAGEGVSGWRIHYQYRILSGAERKGRCSKNHDLAPGSAVVVLYDPENTHRQAPYPLSWVAVQRG